MEINSGIGRRLTRLEKEIFGEDEENAKMLAAPTLNLAVSECESEINSLGSKIPLFEEFISQAADVNSAMRFVEEKGIDFVHVSGKDIINSCGEEMTKTADVLEKMKIVSENGFGDAANSEVKMAELEIGHKNVLETHNRQIAEIASLRRRIFDLLGTNGAFIEDVSRVLLTMDALIGNGDKVGENVFENKE